MSYCSLPWKISIFTGGMISVSPMAAAVKSLNHLKAAFEKPPVRPTRFPKKQLPCWSPALYNEGDKRSNDNVQAVTALVYDLDHAAAPPAEMIARLKKARVRFVLHTTWSHEPSDPRYRIILFLSRPLTPEEYPTAWSNGLRLVGYDSGVDRQARNISRHYALPARREGEEYVNEVSMDGVPLDSSKLSQKNNEKKKSGQKKDAEERSDGRSITKNTKLHLDSGEISTVEELIQAGPGKHKCRCPFQSDASPGSAFLRITKNSRAFLQCTSERHEHAERQFWLKQEKKSRPAAHSVEERLERLAEVPKNLLEYAEDKLAFNAMQGVFYRHLEGAWRISQPIKKSSLFDHLIGLLPKGCDNRHATALVDHILSRQVYGFDCQASKDRIVYQNELPVLNLYAWPDLKPKAGVWPRIEQIVNLLCDDDADARRWLLHWSAALVQHPERRSMVAVLVLSPQQGIGKSLYGRLLSEIIGKGNSAVVSNRALRDSFNSHYVASLLVLADEVGIDYKSGDVVAELKAFITDDRIHCATPYAARTTIINRMSWWLTSNKRRPFLVEQDDRRFTILCPGKAKRAYRNMLRKGFDPKTSKLAPDLYEELQAFASDLSTIDVDWKLISRPFESGKKIELQRASQGSIDSFSDAIRDMGVVSILANFPPSGNYFRLSDGVAARAIPCETLYGSYREWCDRNGRRDVRSENLLRMAIKELEGVKVRKARMGGRTLDVYTGIAGQENDQDSGRVVSFPKDSSA